MGEHVIKLPDVGEGVAEAELVEWHVKVGDLVREDTVLAAVMTDKATVEIPSPVDGEILWLGAEIGEIIAVGSPLIRLKVEGEGTAPPVAEVKPAAEAARLPSEEPRPAAEKAAAAKASRQTRRARCTETGAGRAAFLWRSARGRREAGRIASRPASCQGSGRGPASGSR